MSNGSFDDIEELALTHLLKALALIIVKNNVNLVKFYKIKYYFSAMHNLNSKIRATIYRAII